MHRYRIADLGHLVGERIAEDLVPGAFIEHGGLSFHPGSFCTHAGEQHAHQTHEVFVILQGRGRMEVNGMPAEVSAGDVIVIEPGEEHHLVSDAGHPIVDLWFHCADERHPDQQAIA